jgi:tetratricopeptide (TPR) repeat protein
VNWGRLLQESGALEGAVDHFRAALASAPDLAIAHVYLAEAQIAGGHLAQAQAQLQLDEARMLAPELARTYEIQAALFEDIGLGDLAARERQRATLARVRQPRQGYYDAM